MRGRSKEVREWIPIGLGVVGILFVTGFWALTGRIEPSLVTLFGSLVGITEGANALRDLASRPSSEEDSRRHKRR